MRKKVMLDPHGSRRTHLEISCVTCKRLFWKPEHAVKRSKNNFCSIECCNVARKCRVTVECAFCGAAVEKPPSKLRNSKSGLFFCNRKCKEAAQSLEGNCKKIQPDHYGTGNGIKIYRKRAIQEYGSKCELCGWSHSVQVHHIDGDRTNNTLENLCVLCPNCHSLTETHTFKVDPTIAEEIERQIRFLRE